MHIPDGYLSPSSNAILGVASVLTGVVAAHKTSKTVGGKYLPLISVGAAFSFTLMMFNIPIPDGTTAHATGGTLLTILLGPWAAMISLSIALILQAFFFGDGGILALGANIFNIAVVLPFVSYGIYQLIAGQSNLNSKRRILATALAGYIGITTAALLTGIEFGLQPLLFQSADGTPLYSPYGLSVAVPAMLFAHLLVAGPIEGAITALVFSYLLKSHPDLLTLDTRKASSSSYPLRKFVVALLVLLALSPLGLLATGTAWGEWSLETIEAQLGYIPEGMKATSSFWEYSLFPNYAIHGFDRAFWQNTLGYLLSGLLALVIIGVFALSIQRLNRKGAKKHGSAPVAPRE